MFKFSLADFLKVHLVELNFSRKSHQSCQPSQPHLFTAEAPTFLRRGIVLLTRRVTFAITSDFSSRARRLRLNPAWVLNLLFSRKRSCQTAHHYLGSSPQPSLRRLFPARMRCWCCLNKCLVLRRAPSLRLYPASEWVLHLTQPAKWRFKRLADQLRPVIPTLKIVFKGYWALF